MTESTGVKGEIHCHSGFLAMFGTIKQQGVRSFQGDSHPGPVPGPCTGPTQEGAYSAPRPQLEEAMIFGHCVSCLWHHGSSYLLLQRKLLQKCRELPGTLTNFKGVTITISPPVMGPYCGEGRKNESNGAIQILLKEILKY